MRRLAVLLSLVAVVFVGLLATGVRGPGTDAQDATPASLAGHPLVGSWVVIDPAGGDSPSVSTFTSDGTLHDLAAEGAGGGTWEATGPRSAAATFVVPIADEGFAGTVVIRGTIEVDAAGGAFTSPYSYTVVAADGTVVEAGRGTVEATRIAVGPIEAEGTPLAAVPTWTVAPPIEAEGTPAADAEAVATPD